MQWRRDALQPGPGHAATPGQSCASLSRGGSVMDVASWLRSIGLEQYEATFRDNAITEKVLPKLTAEDLKDLGVSIVGHRRVLLDAITDLRVEAKAEPAPSEPPATNRYTSERHGRRAPPSNGDVLRLGRLDGAIGPHGP